eukprot:jgi/Chrzof1/10505/Cz05g01090.t1
MVSQELARLWDWQHRRTCLGLTPDISPTAEPTNDQMSATLAEHTSNQFTPAVAASEDDTDSSSSDGSSSSDEDTAVVQPCSKGPSLSIVQLLEGQGAVAGAATAGNGSKSATAGVREVDE